MVGKTCTVCRRCSYTDRDLSFFNYPGDRQRRQEWLLAVDRLDMTNKLNNDKRRGNYRICELHFEQKYIIKSKTCEGRKCLSKDAYPTLLLGSKIPIYNNSSLKPTTPQNYTKNTAWKETNVLKQTSMFWCPKGPEISHIRTGNRSSKQVIQGFSLKNDNNAFKDDISIKIDSPDSSFNDSDEEIDISQFCESIIKTTKSTQTIATPNTNMVLDVPLHNINTYSSDKTCFLQVCTKFLSPALCKVIEWSLSTKSKNINLTLLSLSLFYCSDMYNLLKDMLNLPSIDSLKYFLLPKTTKLDKHFINAFRCKVNNMSTRERMCSVSVGSILLKPNLYYDIKHDRIIGLHDVNGTQSTYVAKYALLLMVQGILEDWSQPVAYSFISEYDNYPEISSWIDEVLTELINIGLDIKVFVSDPRSELLYASASRFVSPEKTYFTINGMDIFYTYDTTQLHKIVKNNLKSCNFNCGSKLNSSNNIDFIEKLTSLCNILNTKTQYSSIPFKRAFSNKKYQKEFLDYMLDLLQNLRVVRRADGVDVTENMKFVEDFQITIKSVLQLFEELNFLGVKYLLTSRLNHSCLNNFCNKLKKTDNKEECTPREFSRTFVRSYVFNMLKKPVGQKKVVDSLDSEDFCQQLLDEQYQEQESNINQPLKVFTTDYRRVLPERNTFVYVCGYCYLKCIQQHDCKIFRSNIDKTQISPKVNDSSYVCSISLDYNIGNCEMLPPEYFTEFLMRLEIKFKEYIKDVVNIQNIGREIMQAFENYDFGAPCPCFPVDYLKALFIRVRLFYTIRKNNKLYKRKKGSKLFKAFNL